MKLTPDRDPDEWDAGTPEERREHDLLCQQFDDDPPLAIAMVMDLRNRVKELERELEILKLRLRRMKKK